MRAACPSVCGRTACEHWRASFDNPLTSGIVDIGGEPHVLVALLTVDFLTLPFEVAGIFCLHVDLLLHLLRQPLVAPPIAASPRSAAGGTVRGATARKSS